MRIIISPAKKMRIDTDIFDASEVPVFLDEARTLMTWIKGLSYDDQKALWDCNDSIAAENHERFCSMDLTDAHTPALLSFDGIQYKYMAPAVFEDCEFDYVDEHLRIISGFYGVLAPFDGVTPYRLEMQAKAKAGGCRDLYDYWGDKIYREVVDESRVIINLASKEYSKCVEKYLGPCDRFITCVFGEPVLGKAEDAPKKTNKKRPSEGKAANDLSCSAEPANGKIVQKGVYAKMARGEMVRYMAVNHIADPEDIKSFDWSGYAFDEARSTDDTYVFVRLSKPGSK